MLYIEIPEGMVFTKKAVFERRYNIHQLHDFLIDPQNIRKPIDLQNVVKEALRDKPRYEASSVKELIIHFRLPNKPGCQFLRYAPNHNGALPTQEEPTIIRGNTPTPSSYHGAWFSQIPLSSERLAQIEVKRDEQRHNRRHDGDSPTPS